MVIAEVPRKRQIHPVVLFILGYYLRDLGLSYSHTNHKTRGRSGASTSANVPKPVQVDTSHVKPNLNGLLPPRGLAVSNLHISDVDRLTLPTTKSGLTDELERTRKAYYEQAVLVANLRAEVRAYKEAHQQTMDLYQKYDQLLTQQNEKKNSKERPMPIVISACIGAAALFIILSKRYAEESNKWATGALATVIGFWLRSA